MNRPCSRVAKKSRRWERRGYGGRSVERGQDGRVWLDVGQLSCGAECGIFLMLDEGVRVKEKLVADS